MSVLPVELTVLWYSDHTPVPLPRYAFRLNSPLSLGESLREALDVVLQVAVVSKELHVGTIDLDATSSLLLQVLFATEGSEAPVLRDNNLLAARELVLGSAESLESVASVWILVSNCKSNKPV
jgi:hypothetical protein